MAGYGGQGMELLCSQRARHSPSTVVCLLTQKLSEPLSLGNFYGDFILWARSIINLISRGFSLPQRIVSRAESSKPLILTQSSSDQPASKSSADAHPEVPQENKRPSCHPGNSKSFRSSASGTGGQRPNPYFFLFHI